MLRRKKRIPYDPPGARRRHGRPSTPRRSDQIFLSRRMLLFRGAVAAGFAALIGRLGYMQILRGEHYRAETKKTTVAWIPERPVRGLIFDRAGRTLAENRRVWEVSVIRGELPDPDIEAAEYARVRNTLINALRLPEVLVVNWRAVPLGAERTVYTRIARLLGVTDDPPAEESAPAAVASPAAGAATAIATEEKESPKTRTERFIESIEAEAADNRLVLIDAFTPDQAARFRAIAQELPGVEVINRFDYLVRNTSLDDVPIVLKRGVTKRIAERLLANQILLPGVVLDDSALIRRYPGGEVMSHILGYVGRISPEELGAKHNQTAGGVPIYARDDVIGKNGIELTMEELLRGNRGGRLIEQDGMGFERSEFYRNPPVPGRNLSLTIDLELQALASQTLEDGTRFSNEDRATKDTIAGKPFRRYNALGGAVVVLSPKTGEVLALASFPNYDNQLFVEGISQRKYDEYFYDKRTPLSNKAASAHFPPGSTLKLFTALAGLQEKLIDPSTSFTCTGGIWVPFEWDISRGQRYLCWQHVGAGHGELDLLGAIEQSCDVYFYNVGTPKQPLDSGDNLHYKDYFWNNDAKGDKHYFRGLGIKNIDKYLASRFWFGAPTGIELPFEASGLVPGPNTRKDGSWSAGDTINTSIGQGDMLASPLQLALNTAAVANGGTILRPRLLREIVADDRSPVQAFETKVNRKIKLKREHLDVVRQGMWRVVNEETGTANHHFDLETGERVSKWRLSNPEGEEPIVIAGKTGTAEVGRQLEDGTHEDSHAWFTCYAPFDEPEVVVTVFLDRGGEGSSYAVPIADRVLRAYFELTGKRKRGRVLRADGLPIGERTPAPDPSAEPTDPSATPATTTDEEATDEEPLVDATDE